MRDLIKYIQLRNLTVIEHTPGSVPTSTGVREGNDNRFELDLLAWNGDVISAWRDSRPEKLLEDGLARAAINEGGSGFVKMCLFDRYGGIPYGERVVFTTAPSGTGLGPISLAGESEPDELELALFSSNV